MSSPDPIRNCIPCALTLCRLFLLPLLLYSFYRGAFYVAVSLYLFAILTDLADGFLARRWDAVTHVGTLMDPIVDKLFLCISVGFFTWRQDLPLLFFALTGFRFLGQIFLFMWVRWQQGYHYPYRPHVLPKLSAFSCYALIFFLLLPPHLQVLHWIHLGKIGLLLLCTGLEIMILLRFVPAILCFGLRRSGS